MSSSNHQPVTNHSLVCASSPTIHLFPNNQAHSPSIHPEFETFHDPQMGNPSFVHAGASPKSPADASPASSCIVAYDAESLDRVCSSYFWLMSNRRAGTRRLTVRRGLPCVWLYHYARHQLRIWYSHITSLTTALTPLTSNYGQVFVMAGSVITVPLR